MKSKGMAFICFAVFFFLTSMGMAETFTVNTTADTVDSSPGDGNAADSTGNCSLRAAIMEANALAGEDTIELPAGTFLLTIKGRGEDDCKRGDLDINSNLIIRGTGKRSTFIDAHHVDRIFHVTDNYRVTLAQFTIQGGKTADGKGIDPGTNHRPIP